MLKHCDAETFSTSCATWMKLITALCLQVLLICLIFFYMLFCFSFTNVFCINCTMVPLEFSVILFWGFNRAPSESYGCGIPALPCLFLHHISKKLVEVKMLQPLHVLELWLG